MMHLNSISNLLEVASLTINNTMKDTELQKKMANFGFPPKRMQEGKALLEQALMLDESKIRRYDERWELSYQIKTDLQSARERFLDHVKVARLVFRHEPAMLQKLKINRIHAKVWGWTKQALAFYTQLIPHANLLESHGISLDILEQSKASIEAIMELKEERTRKKGEAEETTRSRNQILKELRAWLVEFRGIARYAMKDNPQVLEAFGIMVPSER